MSNKGQNTDEQKRNTGNVGRSSRGNALKILFHLQHVVPPDIAVVVVNRQGGAIEYSSRKFDITPKMEVKKDTTTGEEKEVLTWETTPRDPNPVYYKFGPFQQVRKVPLKNVAILVKGIKLNDSNMAKFECDVACFVHVSNPITAVTRVKLTDEGRGMLTGLGNLEISEDFEAIIESVSRTAATQQDILDIYKNRSKFQQAVERQVSEVFPKWGIELVDLEIKDIRDVPNSTIIADIERKQAAVIAADATVKVSEEDKRGRVIKAQMNKDAQLVEFESQEIAGKRQFEKDQVLGQAEQAKNQAIQVKTAEANAQTVVAKKTLEVGTAEYLKQVTITNAEAAKQKTILEAEGNKQKSELEGAGEGAQLRLKGEGEGAAIKAKAVGQAEGTERLAEAQKRYAEAGALQAKIVDAVQTIMVAYAESAGKVAENAHINIISGESQDLMNGGIFGKIGLGPKEGAALMQFGQALGLNTQDMEKIAAAMSNPKDLGKTLMEVGRDVGQRATTPAAQKQTVKATN